VGRDPSATISIADERVSRQHGRLRVEGHSWVYEDLGSTNGSYLSGARITRVIVADHLMLLLGNPSDGVALRLQLGPTGPTHSAWRIPAIVAVVVAASAVFAGTQLLPGQTVASPSATIAAPVSPTATPISRSGVVEMGRLATVRIDQGNGLGSGVYLGNNLVLTAAHVVSATARITISFNDRQVGIAQFVRFNDTDDLALLSVRGLDAAGAQPLAWGDSDLLHQGDELVALGFPAGLPLSVKVGVVSGLRVDGTTKLVQTDASLNPGMSGGPVLNTTGQLIGITVFSLSKYPGLNFAVASSTARQFVEGR
jgi:putative serine protease PepD